MTKEQADALVNGWLGPVAQTNAAAGALSENLNPQPAPTPTPSPAPAPAPAMDAGVPQSEPWLHYIQRSPAYNVVKQATGIPLEAAARTAALGYQASQLPGRALRWGISKVAEPVIRGIGAGVDVLRQADEAWRNAAMEKIAHPAMKWALENVVPQTTAQRVRVVSPDGKSGTVPGWAVEDFKAKGYTVVE